MVEIGQLEGALTLLETLCGRQRLRLQQAANTVVAPALDRAMDCVPPSRRGTLAKVQRLPESMRFDAHC
jgi:hypothetical protein